MQLQGFRDKDKHLTLARTPGDKAWQAASTVQRVEVELYSVWSMIRPLDSNLDSIISQTIATPIHWMLAARSSTKAVRMHALRCRQFLGEAALLRYM